MLYRSLILLALAVLLLPLAASAQPSAQVDVLEVKGAIVPVVADYIARGVANAERDGAEALIILLDTPGGLVDSAQNIIQSLLNSRVPVVVYVSPSGAWAGSAGAFITLAGHVAAMAPGTFIGAAHPVAMSPTGGTEALPATQEEKIVNALASTIRSVAQQRGRNMDVAEDMVRKSVAKTASEAQELNLVDLQAEDMNQLLKKLDGRQVTLTAGRTTTLHTSGARVNLIPMSGVEKFLFMISNPNIAYILLSLAMLGIFVELTNPGAIFPGVFGGISLFLALYALGALQAYWAALLLMVLAFGLLITEVFVTSHGMLAAGGIVSLIVGSLFLFSGSVVFQVSPYLIAAIAAGLAAFSLFALRAVIRTHRRQPTWGSEGMVGVTAVVRTPLNPQGKVAIYGELWDAIIDEGSAQMGEEVIIKSVDGLKLRVSKKR